VQKLKIRATWSDFGMKTFFLLSYIIYLFMDNYFFNLDLFWPIRHCLEVYFIIELILVDY